MSNVVRFARRRLRSTSVIGLLLSVFCLAARAGTIDAIYAFGDSLSDVGNIYTLTGGAAPGAPYVNGQFTNGNVWVQDLALDLGLPPLTPSLLGGTDYAYGTGETGITSFNTSPAYADLTGSAGQIAQFQSGHATADPNALYTIWIGSNDLNDMVANAAPDQYGSDIGIIVANVDQAISTLAELGAKNFLIVNVPDLGLTPYALAGGSAASMGASQISGAFDSVLANGSGPIPSLENLASAESVNISMLNTYALLDAIVADPASYGFTNVTQPCLTGEVNYSGGTPCATPAQYLFWDNLHPTATGHELVADEAAGLLTPEPASFLLVVIGVLGLGIVYKSRQRGRRLIFSIAGLCLCAIVAVGQDRADWQSIGQLKTGDRVEVSLKKRGTTNGLFQSWTPDQIVLDSASVRKEDVQRISRFRSGGWGRGKTALLGAAIRGGAGLAVGIGTGGSCKDSFGPCFSRGALGGSLGGIGAIVGAAIGALIPHHHTDVIYAAGA